MIAEASPRTSHSDSSPEEKLFLDSSLEKEDKEQSKSYDTKNFLVNLKKIHFDLLEAKFTDELYENFPKAK